MTRPDKFLILSLTILLYSCTSTQKQLDCAVYKKGRFELHSKLSNSITVIERNDSLQTETDSKTGSVVEARIKWTGACEYELTYLRQTTNTTDTIIPFVQIHTLKTKIIKATKNYYVFQSSMEGVDKTLTDTVRLVK